MLASITKHPTGPRLWLARTRVHHGAIGCMMVAAGAVLALQDRHDWKHWFSLERLV